MYFKHHRIQQDVPLPSGIKTQVGVENFKLLGIVLEQNHIFNLHVDNVCKRIHLLTCLAKYCSKEVLLKAYYFSFSVSWNINLGSDNKVQHE